MYSMYSSHAFVLLVLAVTLATIFLSLIFKYTLVLGRKYNIYKRKGKLSSAFAIDRFQILTSCCQLVQTNLSGQEKSLEYSQQL